MSRAILKRAVQLVVSLLILAVSLFLSAGRLDWIMAWVLLGVYVGWIVVNAVILIRKSPELIAERSEIKAGAKTWDKALGSLVGVCGPLATLIVAGLDARFRWSQQVPLGVPIAGLVIAMPGCFLVTWAMASNKFFSALVRIQKDRGHSVVSDGPYRYVRHPGYVGMILFGLATPLILGSLWALIPAGLTAGLSVVRTALEDKTLQEELEGYRAYAQQVRYRLVPLVW